jgi:hypothetical protein
MAVIIGATFIFMPKGATPFSPRENRYLTALPKITVQQIKNKKFMEQFQKWFSDRFVGRENWIVLRNKTEQAEGKNEINGTFTKLGRIMLAWYTPDTTADKKITNNLNAMNAFAEKYKTVPMYVMIAPTPQEIYRDTIPKNAPVGNERDFIGECYGKLTNLKGISLEDTFLEHKNEYLYYRTDHHWTSLAAYYAYKKAGDVLGYQPYSPDKFNVQPVTDDFRGTTYNKTLDPFIKPDTINIYTLKTGEPSLDFESYTTDSDTKHYSSIYFPYKLQTNQKYEFFFDGNPPIGKIHTDLGENKRKILIFKDSYANAFIPFLTRHYSDITFMDLRYVQVNPAVLVNIQDYDEVLFLYNVISFSEDTNLTKLVRSVI